MFLRRITAMCAVVALSVNLLLTPLASAGWISTKQEISMGCQVAEQLEEQIGLVEDEALQERIHNIGMRMVAVSDRQNLPYSFKVLKSKEVNALAAPGGYIYVFQGLIDLMPSDDELAGVIGHELGHAVKGHSAKQMEKALGANLLFGVLFGGRGALLQNLALNAIMAGYSRSDERQADRLGFEHSLKAGYNPYSMLIGLHKLSSLDQKYQYDLFSDHPEGKDRIRLVQKYLREAGIQPTVVYNEDDKSAQVVDGGWKLPPVYVAADGYQPLLRAYFIAGRLYRLSEKADYSNDRYILDTDGSSYSIYYEDERILTVTLEDAAAWRMDAAALANEYVSALKAWQPN